MIPPISQPNDRSAKWYIRHHGDVFLRLAGMRPFESWRAVANEVVAPRRTPDGLLEVKFHDRPTATPVVIEAESQTSSDNRRQVAEDMHVVRATTGVWPDAILVTLTGPDTISNDNSHDESSPGGTSAVAIRWKTIRLWELEAEDLFALDDVGVIPLIPLTRSKQSATDLLARCRLEIEQKAAPNKRSELLIVSRILASYRYNQESWLDVLLEKRMLTQSPEMTRIINEAKAEEKKDSILAILQDRFSEIPQGTKTKLEKVADINILRELHRMAIKCADLEEFISRAQL